MSTAPMQSSAPAPAVPTATVSSLPKLARAQAKPLPHWLFWSLLLALTAVGGFLRFWRLDFQAYWTDEAYTINRINSTYAYLLGQLANQGFPPGWYALLRLWRIFGENHLHMSAADTYQPGYLRLLPAFFGTLTVPVMCFLGRQFADRKGALLVTLVAAVNPFFVYYSRDIKMYACLYFLVALNMALFFHWQSTRKHLLWFPLVMLTGMAMIIVDYLALAILPLQLIFLLTRPRPKAWDSPLWLLVAGGMYGFYYYWKNIFNNPALTEARISSDVAKGMTWITDYTDMSWKTIASVPTSHILGYLWPVNPPDDRLNNWFLLGGNDFTQHMATRDWSWMARGEIYAAIGLFAILLLGLIPWRRRQPISPERANSVTKGRWWWIFLWIALPTAGLACTWLHPLSYKNGYTPADYPSLLDMLGQQQQDRARAAQNLDAAQQNLAAQPADSNTRSAAEADVKRCQDDLKKIDADLASTRQLIESNWYDRIWNPTGSRPEPLWEPRYLGIVVPAWLLWLAAALRRFPTLPLRILLITAVTGVCTYSSLSNHLFYRNAPLNREAIILEKYIDPRDRLSAAVAIPEVKYPDPAEDTATTIARHVVPGSAQDDYSPYSRSRGGRDSSFWPVGLLNPNQYVNWLRSGVANNPRVKLIVMTDRSGDLPLADDPISDDKVAAILGPRWKLVDEERYEWHYEWRFYIFHTWRTRVWKLQ